MLSQLDTDNCKRIPLQAHVHSTVHAVLFFTNMDLLRNYGM